MTAPEKQRFSYAVKLLKYVRWADIETLLVAALKQWNKQNATRLAGSLAFYSLLSLAPLMLVLVSIVGLFLGHSAAQKQVVEEVESLMGSAAGNAMAAFVKGSDHTSQGVVATIFGLITLLFSASGVVIELRSALNYIWEVPDPQASGFAMITSFIKQRLFSFAMVLGVGFLLIVSLVISTWISAFAALSASVLPGEAMLFHMVNVAFSFILITVLFAAVYKVMPDVKLQWRDVLLGGAVTSLLFTIGKVLLGLYLGRASYSSMYGAAASVVVLIAWVYYSAQIFFLGAEFTREFARRRGSHPEAAARRVSPTPTMSSATTA
ncbi:MAG TPA: YihY/virulence factor BrkB family protein [Bryobacteraceae bacterium]|jgi:membrane protein|nr:YihY/virulence factor BrkB family protein [Bryobacteraceae bacterium]